MEDNTLTTNQLGSMDNMILDGNMEGETKLANSMARLAKTKKKAKAAAVACGDNLNNPALKHNHCVKYRYCWPIPCIK